MEKENDRFSELANAPVGRLLWKYSLPAIVGMMVMSLYNVIDRIYIGHGVGPDAIEGLTITFPVMNISVAFGVLIGAGASARISIVLGMGNKRLAERILGNSFVMTLIFGTFYIAMFGLFMEPLLRLFGASDSSLPYAYEFMMYILPGLMFNNITFSYNNVMRATGYPVRAMVSMFIGAGLNVILAPIFIFGLKWGIKGAAIATDIAMGVSMLFVLWHFVQPTSTIHFKRGTFQLSAGVLLPVIAIGAAPCIVNTAGCLVNAVINNTLQGYGGANVAAMGISVTFIQLLITFVLGLCLGMQPIVGYNYGARKFNRLKRTYWLCVAVATAVCTLGTVFGQATPGLIARMFTTHPGQIAASEHALRIITWVFWGAGFQVVSTNFFQALGDAAKSIFMSLSRQVLFMFPLLLILPSFMGLDGVWFAFPVSDLAAFLIAVVLVLVKFRDINRLAANEGLRA